MGTQGERCSGEGYYYHLRREYMNAEVNVKDAGRYYLAASVMINPNDGF